NLRGISCTSRSACTAVGLYDVGYSEFPLIERWNGTRWSIQHTKPISHSHHSRLLAVSCVPESVCIAVGSFDRNGNTLPLVERWNGTTWNVQRAPKAGGGVLQGVSCASTSTCTAVGYGVFSDTPLVEHWSGARWSIQPTPMARFFATNYGAGLS